MPDRCRSCRAEIRWAVTETGRRMPLDFDPHPDGTIRLSATPIHGGAPHAVVIPPERRHEFAGELYRTHFATCPNAAQHRRRPPSSDMSGFEVAALSGAQLLDDDTLAERFVEFADRAIAHAPHMDEQDLRELAAVALVMARRIEAGRD
jgi:hypothetical protein